MIEIKQAQKRDVGALIETQKRTFMDDNKHKPTWSCMEGPPGYDSVEWNSNWIRKTPYYKIVFNDQIVGGLILFDHGDHYEVGRIWVDPDYQNQGIGQKAMAEMFKRHPEVNSWKLGTPSWAVRNQHFYQKMGFVKIRETEIDPHLGWSGIEYELVQSEEY